MKSLRVFYTNNEATLTYKILFPLLFFLSLVYGFFLYLARAGQFGSYRPQAKVISVGNITLGGSGKTPFVELLIGLLSKRGRHPAVLIRGYKKPRGREGLGVEDYRLLGDEARMLTENLKGRAGVFVGSDRVSIARQADQEKKFDTMVLDDGFQHWGLKRDLDVVMVDATNPFGNGFLLPAGHLREGVSALKRADLICLTRTDEAPEAAVDALASKISGISPQAPLVWLVHVPEVLYDLTTEARVSAESIKNAEVGLLCGIANPISFLRTVERLGGRVVIKKFFEDHHDFSAEELADLSRVCAASHVSKVIVTEKDAARLKGRPDLKSLKIDILVLRIAVKIVKGQEALDERLDSLYHC
jgi:tetraacyldisaccharide 4'-kinase